MGYTPEDKNVTTDVPWEAMPSKYRCYHTPSSINPQITLHNHILFEPRFDQIFFIPSALKRSKG
jgi:hypothetical protein